MTKLLKLKLSLRIEINNTFKKLKKYLIWLIKLDK